MGHKQIAAAFALLVTLSSCADNPSGSDAPSGAPRRRGLAGGEGAAVAVPVVTTHVIRKAVPITIPAVGTVEAVNTVQVRSQVVGQLIGIRFKEGDEVAKGQLLFTIDPRPFQTALEQAQGTLARDTATAANQQAEQARFGALFQQRLISREQYDAQTATAKSSEATLQVDRAVMKSAQLNLQYTRITAPIAGKTGTLGVHTGDLVRANDTTPMVVINPVSPIAVTFSVPGRYLSDIRRYQSQQPLTVQSRTQPGVLPGAQTLAPSVSAPDVPLSAPAGQLEEGRVTFLDNAVNTGTGTITLKGLFGNTDRALWPGLFVQVTLNLATEQHALIVPESAVQPAQEGQYVYVIKPDRTAEMRPVTVERQQGQEMVITKGLSEGEEVVTDGQLRLTPGAHVATTPRGGDAAE
jgi:multidrug efflux system membrane fusion protein